MRAKSLVARQISRYFVLIIGIFLAVALYISNTLVYTINQYEYLLNFVAGESIHEFAALGQEINFALTISFVAFGFAIIATFIVAYLTTSSVVNKEKEYMQLEHEASERAQLMIDGAPIACYLFDMNLNAIDCNQEALNLFDIQDQNKGMEMFGMVFFLHEPMKMMEHINEALQKGFHRFEWELASMPCRISFVRLMHKTDVVIGAYIFDLSPFHKMVEDMKRIAIAEENSKAKSRFLARTSHEIRTPITAVLGISEIQLQNPELSLATEEAFAKIYNSSQVLLGIINDILDLSKIEADKLSILQEKYEFASLINDVVQLNMFRVGSKKIKFKIKIDENIPTIMLGDELRIKQILNNLLSNAFKYTDSGWVNLTAEYHEESGRSWLKFTIQDTGRGMTETQLNNLFEEYVRFNETENRYIEGAGLGLAIVHSLTGLMGGTVSVESEVGEGSTFIINIPQIKDSDDVLGIELAQNLQNFELSEASFAKRLKFKPEPMPYGNVLVVDDVDTNLYVAKGILSFYDLNIDTAENGYEAINMVKDGRVYEIVFMDHMMPGIDGIETTQAMRDAGYAHPVVALTANAVIGQAEVFLRSGFDGFISKPIDISHLNAILNKFIRDKQPTEVVEAARQNSVRFNPEKAEKFEVWDYFSAPSEGRTRSEFAETLRKEFARTQKDVVRNIKADIESGDMTAGRRRAHTLKGLANTIGEASLGATAGRLEQLLEIEETSKSLSHLEILESQMVPVLADISETTASRVEVSLFDELQTKLEESSISSLEVAKGFESFPEAAVLLRQIEDYDFEDALKTLEVLRGILA